MQFGIKGKHISSQGQHVSKSATDGGKASLHYGSSNTGKADQETQSPVLKIFTDMLAREKSFQGYRDPEKAALLRAEHKRDRESKREERRADDRKDDGNKDDSDERKRRSTKKGKKPRTAKKRSTSNPKTKEKKMSKAKISCQCPKCPPRQPVICDDACCQYDAECQSTSREDIVLDEKVEQRATTREQVVEDDDVDRVYEQRERVRERNYKRKMDDTCSCASCVLKKICRNDCICYCCVAFVFIFCLLLAFVLVCKSIPCLRSKLTLFGGPDEMETDRLKRKIEAPVDLQWDGLDRKQDRISNKWDDDRLPGHPVPHSMDSVSYGDLSLSHESDLTKIIDSEKLNDIQGNERLREFYKKLVSTDAKIRKLKKDYLFNIESTNSLPYPDRAKRSLDFKNPFRMFHPRKKIKGTKTESQATGAAEAKQTNTKEDNKVITKETPDAQKLPNTEQENKVVMKETKDTRVKRFDTNEDGLLIEKKKVSIQFVPQGRRTFKCSHAPKEINSYEKPVKNPFYQNSQRLDELLDKFLDKNVMDMIGDPYSHAMISIKKCKHKNKNEEKNETPTTNITEKVDKRVFEVNFNDAKNQMLKNSYRHHHKHIENKNKNNNINRNKPVLPLEDSLNSLDDQLAKSKQLVDHYNRNNQQTNTDDLEEFLKSHGGDMPAITTTKVSKHYTLKNGRTETTIRPHSLLMSISTMMYKNNDNVSPVDKPDDSHKVKDHAAVGRRLMEIETDDGEEMAVTPASEWDGKRKRRDFESNPNTLINPNWKGPMPLFPDELNSINKEGPIIIATEESPETESLLLSGQKNKKKYKFKTHGEDSEYLTDMEYVEDYFRNKYDRVAEMAQAYSDYGVFNDKNIKSQRVDQRFRNYGKDDYPKTPAVKLLGVEKGRGTTPSEGLRIYFVPAKSPLSDVFKALKKHIKFTGSPPGVKKVATTNKTIAFEPFSPSNNFETTKNVNAKVLDVKNILIETSTNMESEFRNIKKRSLQTIDYYQNDPSDALESLMNFRGIFNGLQKKFSTKLGSAQDYAIRVASDYIHDGIYKRDVDSVDVDVVDDTIADNITASDNITANYNISDIYNMTEAVKLVANGTDNVTAETIETGAKIATGDVRNDTEASLSDFFMKLANWFNLLDTLDLSVNKSQQENVSSLTNNTTDDEAKNQPKLEFSFPLYDADMIENIGHRSRVLLGVNETEAGDDSNPDDSGKGVGDTQGDGVVGTETQNITLSDLGTVNIKENRTKTIVKRDVDGKLLWNDVYNDDYGADAENIDGSDDKQNAQGYGRKAVERKHDSEDWFKKIVTKLKEGAVKYDYKRGRPVLEGSHRNCGKFTEGKPMLNKVKLKHGVGDVASRRFYRKADSDYPTTVEKKTDFTALTAKMKKICQKAAKDISLSKKLEVREDSKEGQVASKLMQQLVGLMSDLVQYQVHEKTCRKLPLDLQNFLEWLTNPDSTVMTYHKENIPSTNNKEPYEEFHTLEVMSPGEEKGEPRADYMSAMSSVRDLLIRYDSLSEDDKSKMSGVREYLVTQLEYLQKQLYMTNDFNMFTGASRYKRNAKGPNSRNHIGKINSVTFRRYMKRQNRGGNNVTKNLYSSDKGHDIEGTTNKVMTIAVHLDEKSPDEVKPEKSENDKVKNLPKRNLKDVYYRALEELKLMTAATIDTKLTSAMFNKTAD